MENHLKNPVLKGLNPDDIQQLRKYRCMREKQYKKDEVIFRAGDRTEELGIVLEGDVLIENIDLWDNMTILSSIGTGGVFAETYALLDEPLQVDAVAGSDCSILLIRIRYLMQPQFAASPWQHTLFQNMLAIANYKNLTLSRRIFCTASKRVRDRLLTYLSGIAIETGRTEFDIPFNRQQLADYLNLDRSALSRELCLMRDEGLLSFHKNHFRLANNKTPHQ